MFLELMMEDVMIFKSELIGYLPVELPIFLVVPHRNPLLARLVLSGKDMYSASLVTSSLTR